MFKFDNELARSFPSPLGDPYIQMYATNGIVFRYTRFPSPLGDPYIQILSFSPRINPIIFATLAAQTKLAPQEALKPFKKSRFC